MTQTDRIHSHPRNARSVEDAAAAFDLQPELAALARAVARRTRLPRREQARVAMEVAQVIRGHLDAGARPEEVPRLIGDLGELAARQRRQRITERGIAARLTAHWRLGLLLLALSPFLLYLTLLVRFELGSPTVARNFSAEGNARFLAMAAEDRAEMVYIEAHRLMGPIDRDFSASVLSRISLRPGDEAWADAAAFAAQVAPALALVRRAAAMPVFGHILRDSAKDCPWWLGEESSDDPPTENPQLYRLLLPYIGPLRVQANLLGIEAVVAASRGDGALAAHNLHAVLGIVGHLRERPMHIVDGAAYNLIVAASERLRVILREYPGAIEDEALERLSEAFAALDDEQVCLRLDAEREGILDLLQRTYTDNGRGDGRITPAGMRLMKTMRKLNDSDPRLTLGEHLKGPWTMLTTPRRSEMLSRWEAFAVGVEAVGRLPVWKRPSADLGARLEQLHEEDDLASQILTAALPMSRRVLTPIDDARIARDATIAVIALERYRLAHGAYPASLRDLVPRFIDPVPVDQYDGSPLKYKLAAEGPVLYSVGFDGVDDGGSFETVHRAIPGRPAITSDLRLWPILPPQDSPGHGG